MGYNISNIVMKPNNINIVKWVLTNNVLNGRTSQLRIVHGYKSITSIINIYSINITEDNKYNNFRIKVPLMRFS